MKSLLFAAFIGLFCFCENTKEKEIKRLIVDHQLHKNNTLISCEIDDDKIDPENFGSVRYHAVVKSDTSRTSFTIQDTLEYYRTSDGVYVLK